MQIRSIAFEAADIDDCETFVVAAEPVRTFSAKPTLMSAERLVCRHVLHLQQRLHKNVA